MKIALEETGSEREAALRALASAQTKRDFLVPEAIRLLSRSGSSPWIRSPIVGPDRLAVLATDLLRSCPDHRAETAHIRAVRFHPSSKVRERAVGALVSIAPDDNSIVNVLIDSLDDTSATSSGFAGTGSTAEEALDQILQYRELPADAAVPLITKLYRDSYEGQYLFAQDLCEAVCRCPTADKHAAELVQHKLQKLLDDDAYFRESDSQSIRIAAASIVLKWNPKDRVAAKFLADGVGKTTDRNFSMGMAGRIPDVRAQAARGLGRVGPMAREWLPMLHEVLRREVDKKPLSELAFDAAWAFARRSG